MDSAISTSPHAPARVPAATPVEVPPATLAQPAEAAQTSTLRRQFPNALTIARVVIAGAFFVVLSIRPGGSIPTTPDMYLVIATALFIIAAITDIFDGHLSRKWGVTSRFGRVMDPFADKMLVVGSFIFLAAAPFRATLEDGTAFQLTGVTPWMAVVVLARELLVTSIRALVESSGGDFRADWSGKFKMLTQCVAVPTIIGMVGLFDVRPGTNGRTIVDAFAFGAVLITALSTIPYVVRGVKCLGDISQD